jgi:hypothetical protein
MASAGALLVARGGRQCVSFAWWKLREPLSDALSQNNRSSSLASTFQSSWGRCVVKEIRTFGGDFSPSIRRSQVAKNSPAESCARGRSTFTAERTSATVQEAAQEAKPTLQQLRVLALHAALPMVGFGIMDQTIMIQAGDLIDSTIGIRFALPTLAAAACGQVTPSPLKLPATIILRMSFIKSPCRYRPAGSRAALELTAVLRLSSSAQLTQARCCGAHAGVL